MSYTPHLRRENGYSYGGYLKHYRTKGSRNGYSNDPNYKPVGQRAQGELIDGRYVYEGAKAKSSNRLNGNNDVIYEKRIKEKIIPEKRIFEKRTPSPSKPIRTQPQQKQNWFQRGVSNVGKAATSAGNWLGDRGRDAGKAVGSAASNAGRSIGKAATSAGNWLGDRGRDAGKAASKTVESVKKAGRNVTGFVTGSSTKEADKKYDVAKINSKYANRAGIQRIKNVDNTGKKRYETAFDNALNKGRERLNQRANAINTNRSLQNRLSDALNERDSKIDKAKDGREKTYRRNEYGEKISEVQNESRVGGVEANRKAAQSNKEFRKAAEDVQKAKAKRSVDNASTINEVRISSVEKNRKAAEARKEKEKAHERTLPGIISNPGKAAKNVGETIDTASKDASKWISDRFGEAKSTAKKAGKAVGSAASKAGEAVGEAAKETWEFTKPGGTLDKAAVGAAKKAGKAVGKAANEGLENAKSFVKKVTGIEAKEERERQEKSRRQGIDTAEKTLSTAKTASEREKALRDLIKAHDSGPDNGMNERGNYNKGDTKLGPYLERAKNNIERIDNLENNIKKGYYSGKELDRVKREIAENRIDNELTIGEFYNNKNASGKWGPMYNYKNGEKQLNQKNIYPENVPDNVSKQDWDRYVAENYGHYPNDRGHNKARSKSSKSSSKSSSSQSEYEREKEFNSRKNNYFGLGDIESKPNFDHYTYDEKTGKTVWVDKNGKKHSK
jgi:hypothetical protein